MLPHQGFVVPFIFDDAGQALLADLLRHQTFRHIIYEVADRAGIGGGPFICHQPHAALAAGEFLHLGLLRHGVDGFMADRTKCLLPLGLVKHHLVAAVGAGTSRQFLRLYINGVPAGAVDLLSCKKSRFRFHIPPAVGTLHDKFCHNESSLHSVILNIQSLVSIR